MLSRVRRSDIFLAVIAAVGLAAGLVGTIAAKFGVSGPVVLVVGIVAALAIPVRKFWDPFAGLRSRERQERDLLEAICMVRIEPMDDVDPFKIGVFPSELAKGDQPAVIRRRMCRVTSMEA